MAVKRTLLNANGDVVYPVTRTSVVFGPGVGSEAKSLDVLLSEKEPVLPSGGTTSKYLRGDKTWQTIDKTIVGLDNVDNTSDNTKQAAFKTAYTGTIASGNTNFAIAGDVFDALEDKQDQLTPGTNITISNNVISASLPSAIVIKGVVASKAELPASGQEVGDMYIIHTTPAGGEDDGKECVWAPKGTTPETYGWEEIGFIGTVDLDNYYTKDETYNQTEIDDFLDDKQDSITSTSKISSDLIDDTAHENQFVTQAQKGQIATNATNISNILDGENISSFGDVEAAIENLPVPSSIGTIAQYLRGDATWQTLNKTAVGLDNVDNTSDSTKKTNFTGSIASGNTGFITGGAAYTALQAYPTMTDQIIIENI